MKMYITNANSLLVLSLNFLLVAIVCVNAWEDDYHYFTSFKDVSEWAKMYPDQCDEAKHTARHHLSPIPLPKSSKAKRPRNGSRSLWIYNHPPPPKLSYAVQYGFPNNKECIQTSFFNPCYISPSYGLVRAVVVSAERERLTKVRRDFKIQEPEKFVTLRTGIEGVTEKKFYEAVFLGTTDCGQSKKSGRRTHTIDGKSYPMEINMYFVDESLPVMLQTVILVVLVEEQEEDNDYIKPVVKAVHNHLEKIERQSLYDLIQNSSYGRERTFHHLGNTVAHTILDNEKVSVELNSSAELFRSYINIQEDWERVLTLGEKTLNEEDKRAATIPWLKKTAELLKSEDIKPNQTQFYRYWFYPAVYRALGHNNETLVGNLTYSDLIELKPIGDRIAQPLEPLEEELATALKEYMNLQKEARSHTAYGAFSNDKKHETVCKATTIAGMKQVYLKRKEDNQTLNNAFFTIADHLKTLTGGMYDFLNNETNERNETELFKKRIQAEEEIASLKHLFAFKTHVDEVDKRIDEIHAEAGYNSSEEAEAIVKSQLDSRKELFFAEEQANDTLRKIHDYNAWTFKKIGPVEGGNLGMTHSQFEEFYKSSPIKSYVQSEFQISWLIPEDGGYYIYQGSSAVPPCYEAEHVLVFKKPIKMSKTQIKALTTIPTTHRKDADITSTLPLIHKLNPNAPEIIFEKRRHLFLHDDKVHKSAINTTGDSSGSRLGYDLVFSLIACGLSLVM